MLFLLLVGLAPVPPESPMMMSAAQCVMLARSAARAERTEALKETKNLTKRECMFSFLFWVLFCSADCYACFFGVTLFVCRLIV